MKRLFILLLSSLSFAFYSCSSESSESQKPNIIYILADDLGYGELGSYGQKLIETPNIDKLATGGMKFTQHYSGAPVCAPARCVLLTGKHSGNAHIRGNDEWKSRGDVGNFQAMFDDPNLEGQRPLPDSVITLPEMLQEAGYVTGGVGKWGLGAPNTEGVPSKQGFDLFYGYNCQRQAHTYYPMHLWRNEEKVLLNNKLVAPNTKLSTDADPNDEAAYADFTLTDYAPNLMHQEALGFIEKNQDKPFFLYYASPVPHVPLQAPQRWVEYYKEKLGEEAPYDGNKGYFPNRTPNATYAAMISYLDEQVGELVTQLKTLGLYENTLIIFSSDNGPTYAGGANTPFFDSAAPFVTEKGRGKGSVYEGGIRVPMIAHWPGHIKAGSISNHISAFQDVYPTLAELTQASPKTSLDGLSFLPSLLDKEQAEHPFLYWEFPESGGQQALRMGKWKAVRQNIKKGELDIELYNLETDLQEQNNVASEHPELIEKIKTIFLEEHTVPVIDKFKLAALGD
ncbi:MAG: arylsulfatase A-like enzyme [Arcticibacterium sp.]|jgi:arylsulfatase A-like enzyme